MSKKVSFLISIMLVIALLPISVFAANGPRPKGTEIRNFPFGSLDTYTYIPSQNSTIKTDTNGNITLYYENGNVSYVTNSDGSQYTTYYPDGSVSSARDVSGTEYHFEQGENVRTAAPVSETPIEYNELESMPPNTTLDEDGNIVIRDNIILIIDNLVF